MKRDPLLLFVLVGLSLQAACTRNAPVVHVAAAGDLQLGSELLASDPLAGLDTFFTGDVRFLNLEEPLAGGPSNQSAGKIVFAGNAANVRWLARRVDVASLANNHALDQGEDGRARTAGVLGTAGIIAAWRGHDATLFRYGRHVEVFAREFDGDSALAGGGELLDAVRTARAQGPVIVSLHWGRDGSLLPTTAQREFAANLVDAGATAVLGHGPHSLQGVERHGAGIIAYSMGNLAFHCTCTAETDAYALTFAIAADGAASDVVVHPLVAGINSTPRVSVDAELARLIAMLSRDLGSDAAEETLVVRIR